MSRGESTPRGAGQEDTARRGARALAGGLLLVVLGWAAIAAAMDPQDPPYEGYGPVEEFLLHRDEGDPPVPEPIGPRLLRDRIPAVGSRMQDWPPFFRDLQLDLHLRSFYFNRELPIRPIPATGSDVVRQEAWALGGWIGMESGWLLDTFRLGATGYTSQPAYAPDDRDGTGLLALGQEGITVLGQAYGQLRYKDYALLTGGRMLVTEGFVNPQDNRMIPNTFEGALLTGTLGPVDYGAGYLTAHKRRNFDTFDNMATTAGVTTGENRGLILTTLTFVPDRSPERLSALKGLEAFVGNYYVPDVFNTVFVNPEYRIPLNEDWRLQLGAQYWDQRSVGDNLLGKFETWQTGARVQLGWRELTFVAMGSVTGDDAGIRAPYGGWRGYISLAETDPNFAGEKAWEAGILYDWGGKTSILRVPGLWTSLLYSENWDLTAKLQNAPVPKRRELDLFTVYRPPAVPGLQFRMLISNVFLEGRDRDFYDVRFIVDFELPLL
jgi:hypothetical protein